MDYLGNKSSLAADIIRHSTPRLSPGAVVADVFAGTGAVSLALARSGFNVHANDHLPLSAVWTTARLLGRTATFEGLREELGPLGDRPLETVLAALRTCPGEDGWVTQNYSPVALANTGVERRYLSVENARVIDAVRVRIRAWRPLLTNPETALLLTCLLESVAAVSNIAGTYGCYLKHWKASALRPLSLEPFQDIARGGHHRITCQNADVVAAESVADLLYADPPYTKRQYGAYYHLLNSIASDSEDEVSGLTGLPNWRKFSSDWCYKARAANALEELVAKSSAPRFALSYSSDGHILDTDIRDILEPFGSVDVYEFPRRRFRSSSLPHKGSTVIERLYVMTR